ncbi:MAG: protein-L-isoaspartate O-methyltransferase family protein, partial [Nitrospirales bacterium]
AKAVHSIERIAPLAQRAEQTLSDLGYDNVHVRVGDGYQGWPEEAPFEAIIVTAAPEEVPPALLGQLALGGRMILPVGDWSQHLVLIERTPDGFRRRALDPVAFVPMVPGTE